jgi:hypothetical protein
MITDLDIESSVVRLNSSLIIKPDGRKQTRVENRAITLTDRKLLFGLMKLLEDFGWNYLTTLPSICMLGRLMS